MCGLVAVLLLIRLNRQGAPAASTTRVRCGKTEDDEDSGSAGTPTGGVRVSRGRRMPTATIEIIQ